MVAARPASPATVRTATTRVATSAAACRRDVRTVPPQGGVACAGPCARRRRDGERVDMVERLGPAEAGVDVVLGCESVGVGGGGRSASADQFAGTRSLSLGVCLGVAGETDQQGLRVEAVEMGGGPLGVREPVSESHRLPGLTWVVARR